jgi:DNA-binding CsgD family transcriptional regulator
MGSLFSQRCMEVLQATSVKDFSRQIVAFANGLGFSTVGAVLVIEHSPSLTEFRSLTNAPEGHREEFDNFEHGRIDPVNQHCKVSNSPIVWNRETYAKANAQDLWESQAPYGYRSGIAFALHLGRGRHYMFGANWELDRCDSVRHFKSIYEDLLIFGAHSQAAAFELCMPGQADPANVWSLTKGELEALRWSMDGMTSWEIGQKMALSGYDVTLRLQRTMQKLECGTKYEAVLKGIRLGLIQAT